MRDQLQVESERFHKNLDNGCWHEGYGVCTKCGYSAISGGGSYYMEQHNPTYDNPAVIRAEMGDKWDGFVKHMRWRITLICEHVALEHGIYLQGSKTDMIADILTDPLLLLQAANAYMEG